MDIWNVSDTIITEEMLITKNKLRVIDKELGMIPLTFYVVCECIFERNLDIQLISEITGKTIEEIDKIT